MPKGLRRFHHTGDWHFITCSCYRRQKFLDSLRRRDVFLDILEQVRAKYDFVVAARDGQHRTPCAGVKAHIRQQGARVEEESRAPVESFAAGPSRPRPAWP